MTDGPGSSGGWLSPLSLSWRALGWFAIIGIAAVLITVPEAAGSGVWSWRWWLVAVAGQVACTVVVTAGRPLAAGRWSSQKVLMVLALAGAVRGAVIAWSGQSLGVISDPSWASRIGNSVLVTVVLLGFLGLMFRSAREYDEQYRTLVERAVAVEVARSIGEPIDSGVLRSWSSVKGRIDEAVRVAQQTLESPGSSTSLRKASSVLRDAVDDDIRPTSRELMGTAALPSRGLRWYELLSQAIDPWRPPVAAVMVTLGLIVGLGSFVRLGITTAASYTLTYLLAVGLALLLSTSLARRTGRDRAVAITTLALMPPMVFALGLLITMLPGVISDPVGGALVALQTPATTIVVTMVARLSSERRAVLESLQSTIDSGTVSLLATDIRRRDDALNLGTYVHHSLQSELSALAIQMDEAAAAGDPLVVEKVRLRVLERLGRLEAIDPTEPPWLRSSTGRERIDEIARAWEGIAEVSLELGPADAGRLDQWHIAAQIVEEGLANAVRHGGARRIAVTVRLQDDSLIVAIDDDGILSEHAPGAGSRWLDSTVGEQWSRTVIAGRTRLEASIR